MAEPFDLSRRKALKIFAGVPMLPLGGLATASMLSACGGGSDPVTPAKPVANFVSAAFNAMAAPTLANPAAMATTTVGSTLTVQLSDGSSPRSSSLTSRSS